MAKSYFKLMAYKDEYEVARLYTDGQFVERLKQQFEGDFTLTFNLAPPLLAKLKKLRGTKLDVFGYTAERRMERQLIAEYRSTVLSLLDRLNADNLALAVDIASLSEKIRGFGHVKEKAIKQFRTEQEALMKKYVSPQPGLPHAA